MKALIVLCGVLACALAKPSAIESGYGIPLAPVAPVPVPVQRIIPAPAPVVRVQAAPAPVIVQQGIAQQVIQQRLAPQIPFAPASLQLVRQPVVAPALRAAAPIALPAPVAAQVPIAAPAPVATPLAAALPVAAPAPVSLPIAAPAPVATPLAAAVPAPVVAPVPAVATSQFHAQDEFGGFNFGYQADTSARQEVRLPDGTTRGRYSYVDANGIVQNVEYIADPVNGFRVAASNLPIGPETPAGVAVAPVAALPVPVAETPEVAAARLAHEQAFAEATAAATTIVVKRETDEEESYGKKKREAEDDTEEYGRKKRDADADAEPGYGHGYASRYGYNRYNKGYSPRYGYNKYNRYNKGYSYSRINRYNNYNKYGYANRYGYGGYKHHKPAPVVVPAPAPVVEVVEQVIPAPAPVVQVVEQVIPAPAPVPVVPAPVPVVPAPVPVPAPILPAPVPVPAPIQEVAIAEPQVVVPPNTRAAVPLFSRAISSTRSALPAPLVAQTPAIPVPAAAAPVATPLAIQTPASLPIAGTAVPTPLALAAAPAPVATTVNTQFHAQDELGGFNFGFVNDLSARQEVRSPDGVTQGRYSYVDANGVVQHVEYVADPINGFRVAATNIPVVQDPAVVAPVAVKALPVPEVALPIPVVDTPEVVAARAEFQAAFDAATLAAAAA